MEQNTLREDEAEARVQSSFGTGLAGSESFSDFLGFVVLRDLCLEFFLIDFFLLFELTRLNSSSFEVRIKEGILRIGDK